MKIDELSLIDLAKAISEQKITSYDATKFYIEKCEERKDLNAILEIFDDALDKAKEMDEKN